jgi:ATPase subunit of ABC transporter with duplicated ATPase domains
VGYVDVQKVSFVLPDGRLLLDEVSFRVGEGNRVALVGPNGAGKTTLMRVIAGDLTPSGGNVASAGGLGVMRQFIGSVRDETTVRELLLSVSPPAVRAAGRKVDEAAGVMMERDCVAGEVESSIRAPEAQLALPRLPW